MTMLHFSLTVNRLINYMLLSAVYKAEKKPQKQNIILDQYYWYYYT